MRISKGVSAALLPVLAFAAVTFADTGKISGSGVDLNYDMEKGSVLTLSAPGICEVPLNVESVFQIYVQQEGEKEGKWLNFDEFVLEKPPAVSKGNLSCEYAGPDKIKVVTTVSLKPSHTVEWHIKVINGSPKYIMCVRYPVLKNIFFTPEGKEDELLFPLNTGSLTKTQSALPAPTHYPRAWMNFLDISGGGRGMAFVGDSTLIINEFGVARGKTAGSLDVRMETVNSMPPGGEASHVFTTYLHEGNWREAADYYREWFYSHFSGPNYPEWLRRSNGWVSIMWGADFSPAYGTETREHINETWRLGISHLQFWGQTGMHACPGFPLPDPLRGGEEGITKMFRMIRDAGMHTGGYYFSCGIDKFVVLAGSYRGVPWTDYPEELRAPSWQWLVENSQYPDAERKEPDKTLAGNAWKRANVADVKEAEEKKLTPQVLHIMSFLSPEYRKWLSFWVKRYTEKYGADTPYLDVYGLRPKEIEFSPYLKKFGDGTEGQYRLQFLKDVITEMRRKEPSFVPFLEGGIDAYVSYAPGLISNFRRFMDVYRYVHSGHMLYEGNANGWWNEGTSVQAISNAFLDGNRFDLMLTHCNYTDAERIVWMRDSFIPWLNEGRYAGYHNFEVSSEKIQAKLTNADVTLGSSLITVRNVEAVKDGIIKLGVDLQKNYKSAFIMDINGRVEKITDLTGALNVPETPASAVILTGKKRSGTMLPFVMPAMTAEGITYKLTLLNMGANPLAVDLSVVNAETGKGIERKNWKIPGEDFLQETYILPKEIGGDRMIRLEFNFTWRGGGMAFKRTYDPNVEDPSFEWRKDVPVSSEHSKDGKYSLKLEKGGRERITIKLAPETDYAISVSSLRHSDKKAFAVVYDSKKRKGISNLREISSTVEGQWGEVSAVFKTDAEGWLRLYFYNHGETPIYYDNITIKPAPVQ